MRPLTEYFLCDTSVSKSLNGQGLYFSLPGQNLLKATVIIASIYKALPIPGTELST